VFEGSYTIKRLAFRGVHTLAVLAGFLCLSQTSLAYVGPGSGITMIGSLLAVIGAVILTIVGILLWPLRLLMRRLRNNRRNHETVANPNSD
jgi:hypothetical protein